MRQLTAVDALFLDIEDERNLGHVGFLAVVDPATAPGGSIDAAAVRGLVRDRLHLLPPFRWRLADVPFGIDRPYWIEDPDVDLSFHVRELALPPGSGDGGLAEQVAGIHSRPLDRGRPLWELHVIHGLPSGDVALLAKIHHAVVDGFSGVALLGALLDLSPVGREVPAPDDQRRPPAAPSELELFWRGAFRRMQQPLEGWRAATQLLPAPAAGRPPRRRRRALPLAPDTRFNGRVSGRRRFACGQLPLERVKAIKDAHGATVNDVVLAVCAGALREWLLERDELPADRLVALVPVSIRAPEEMGTYGNRVSGLVVPIPTDEPVPRRRLRRAHATMRAAKDRHDAIPMQALQDFAEVIPPAVTGLAARTGLQLADLRPVVNCTISNVPGPQTPLYIAGAQLKAAYPVSMICDGMGLNITVMSYCGHLDVGIVADGAHVDDVASLADAMRDALAAF